MNWREWFLKMMKVYPNVSYMPNDDYGCVHWEDQYQAFKSRLMEECSVMERMTPEEFEEWKERMVRK